MKMLIERFDEVMLSKVNKETHAILKADVEEFYLKRPELETFIAS